jgi:hypothetical protein
VGKCPHVLKAGIVAGVSMVVVNEFGGFFVWETHTNNLCAFLVPLYFFY